MKLKVKTKLRNEKDELQVDDVSPLFSTINEGIDSGEVATNKKLYRHSFLLKRLQYNGYVEVSRGELINENLQKITGSVPAYPYSETFYNIWRMLFANKVHRFAVSPTKYELCVLNGINSTQDTHFLTSLTRLATYISPDGWTSDLLNINYQKVFIVSQGVTITYGDFVLEETVEEA